MGTNWLKAALQKGPGGSSWTKYWTWASNVPAKAANNPWAASGSVTSRLREVMLPCYLALVRHIWSTGSSYRLADATRDMDILA